MSFFAPRPYNVRPGTGDSNSIPARRLSNPRNQTLQQQQPSQHQQQQQQQHTVSQHKIFKNDVVFTRFFFIIAIFYLLL